MKTKKQLQLGMNPSTASGRLVKDILFSFIKEKPCCKCGKLMDRETFSIEHIKPWLDSEDPVKLFFDLNNIDFSHIQCNIKEARKPWAYKTQEEKEIGYRKMMDRNNLQRKSIYSPEKRRKIYLERGY